MRNELEDQSFWRYPAPFTDRALSLTESAMGRGFCRGDDVTQGMVAMAVTASERICESSDHPLDTGSGPQNA